MLLLSIVVGAVVGFTYTYAKQKLETDDEEYLEEKHDFSEDLTQISNENLKEAVKCKIEEHKDKSKKKKKKKAVKYPEWKPPDTLKDLYMENDIVTYQGKTWLSTRDCNPLKPGERSTFGANWIQIK